MSKKEILAWTSLGTAAAILGYYVIALFGLPDAAAAHEDALRSLFFRVIVISVLVEVALEIIPHTKLGMIEKDERDAIIEGKGYRNAYLFLIVAVVVVLVNIFVSDAVGLHSAEMLLLGPPFAAVHALLIVLFVSSIVHSTTRIYYYRAGVRYGTV